MQEQQHQNNARDWYMHHEQEFKQSAELQQQPVLVQTSQLYTSHHMQNKPENLTGILNYLAFPPHTPPSRFLLTANPSQHQYIQNPYSSFSPTNNPSTFTHTSFTENAQIPMRTLLKPHSSKHLA